MTATDLAIARADGYERRKRRKVTHTPVRKALTERESLSPNGREYIWIYD